MRGWRTPDGSASSRCVTPAAARCVSGTRRGDSGSRRLSIVRRRRTPGGGLRPDQVPYVLDGRCAQRVVGLAEHLRPREAACLVPSKVSSTSLSGVHPRAPPRAVPALVAGRRPDPASRGGASKRPRRDGVAVQDDRSSVDPCEEDTDREQWARRAPGRSGSWTLRGSPDGESQLVEPRTVAPAAARAGRDRLFSGQQGGERGHHGAPRRRAQLPEEPGLKGRSPAREL